MNLEEQQIQRFLLHLFIDKNRYIIDQWGKNKIYNGYSTKLNDFLLVRQIETNPHNKELISAKFRLIKNNFHENIVQIIENVMKESALFVFYRKYNLTLDKVKQKQSSIKTKIKWIEDILQGLSQLHRLNLIHLDLRPSSCYLNSQGHCIIARLQCLINFYQRIQINLQTGYYWLSPQIIHGIQTQDPIIIAKRDIWCLGLIVFFIFTGKHLFSQVENITRLKKEHQQIKQKLNIIQNAKIKSFIQSMMQLQPNNRPDIFTLKKKLQQLLLGLMDI